jgi:integrase
MWDTEIAGFGVRLTKAGAAAFIDYRDQTRTKRRFAIGKVLPAELTVEQARQRAAAYKVSIRAGADPVAEKRAAAAAAMKAGAGLTVETAIVDWLARRKESWSAATHAEYERALRKDIIPQLGHLPLSALNRQLIMAEVSRVGVRSKSTSAGLFRILGSFVRHCDDMGLIEGLTLPKAKSVAPTLKPRSRMPDDEGLARIWRATNRLRPHSRALARLIILTAQRRRTVEGMQWTELDLEGGRWRIPGNRMKNGEEHEVALSPFVVEELKALPRKRRSVFVFSGSSRPPQRLNRILKTMQAEAGGGWSWHDFRRAFMTWAVSHGHPREFAKIALSHLIKDRLDQAYDQHNYRPEAARVMLGWQSYVVELLDRRSKVVPIRRIG